LDNIQQGYTDQWRCPLTRPTCGRLTVAGRAGEKVFEGHADAEEEEEA